MTKSTATTPARGRPSSAPTPPAPYADINNNAFSSSPRRMSTSRLATPSSSSSNHVPTSDDRSTTPRASTSKPTSTRPSPLATPSVVTSPRSTAAISKSAPTSATFPPRSPSASASAANHVHNNAHHHPSVSRSTSVSPNRRLSDSALADNIRIGRRSAAAASASGKTFPHTPAHPRMLPTTTPMTERSANKWSAPPGRDTRRMSHIGIVPTTVAAAQRASRSSLERAQRQYPMWVNLPPCVAQSFPVTIHLDLPSARYVDVGDADALYKLATNVIATAGMEALNEDDEVLRRKVNMFQASLRTLESNYPTHLNSSPHPCTLALPHLRNDLIYIQAANQKLPDLCFRVLIASFIGYCTDDVIHGQVHQPVTADEYLALAEVCLEDFDANSESEVMDMARTDEGEVVQLVRRKVKVEGSVARLAMVFLCLAFDSGANGQHIYASFHKDLAGQHAMWGGMFDLWNAHTVSTAAHPPQPMPGDARELLRQHVWDRVKLLSSSLTDVPVPNPRTFIKPDPDAGAPGTLRKRSRLSDPVPLAARRMPPMVLDMTADSDLDEDEMAKQVAEQEQASKARGGHRVTASGAHKRQHTISSSESVSSPAKAKEGQAPPFKRLKRMDDAAQMMASPARRGHADVDMDTGAWDNMDVDSDTGPFFAAPPPPPPPAPPAAHEQFGAGDVMMQGMIDEPYQDQDDDLLAPPHRLESESPGRTLNQGGGVSSSPSHAFTRGTSASPVRTQLRGTTSALASPARTTHVRSVSASPARAGPQPRAAADPADPADPAMPRRRRAPRIKWTPDEEALLERAMGECEGSWARILRKYPDELGRFTQVQLKDKARNLRAKREKAGEELRYLAYATRYPDKDREVGDEQQELVYGRAGRRSSERLAAGAAAAAAATAGGQDGQEEQEEDQQPEVDEWGITIGTGSGRMARQLGQPLVLTNAQGAVRDDEDEEEAQQDGQGQEQEQARHGQPAQAGEREEVQDVQELAPPPSAPRTRRTRASLRRPSRPMPRTRASARLAASQNEADGQEQDGTEAEEEGQEREKMQEEGQDEYHSEDDDDDDDDDDD